MTSVLITGGSGQLGTELQRAALPPAWIMSAPGRAKLDLAAPDSVARAVDAFQPDLIINAGGFTAVDKAESEPEMAFALNRDAPQWLARAAAARGAAMVHISTDYVFDGLARRPYREGDRKAPLSVYGRSKSEGEDAVLAAHPHAVIVRTSWVFSAHRRNFLTTMLRLNETLDEISVVADQHGRPTAAADLSAACVSIGQALLASDKRIGRTLHFANAGDVTWAGFAEAILAGAAERGRKPTRVKRIASAEYDALAKRPTNSRLDTTKLESVSSIRPRHWCEALRECLDELLGKA